LGNLGAAPAAADAGADATPAPAAPFAPVLAAHFASKSFRPYH